MTMMEPNGTVIINGTCIQEVSDSNLGRWSKNIM